MHLGPGPLPPHAPSMSLMLMDAWGQPVPMRTAAASAVLAAVHLASSMSASGQDDGVLYHYHSVQQHAVQMGAVDATVGTTPTGSSSALGSTSISARSSSGSPRDGVVDYSVSSVVEVMHDVPLPACQPPRTSSAMLPDILDRSESSMVSMRMMYDAHGAPQGVPMQGMATQVNVTLAAGSMCMQGGMAVAGSAASDSSSGPGQGLAASALLQPGAGAATVASLASGAPLGSVLAAALPAALSIGHGSSLAAAGATPVSASSGSIPSAMLAGSHVAGQVRDYLTQLSMRITCSIRRSAANPVPSLDICVGITLWPTSYLECMDCTGRSELQHTLLYLLTLAAPMLTIALFARLLLAAPAGWRVHVLLGMQPAIPPDAGMGEAVDDVMEVSVHGTGNADTELGLHEMPSPSSSQAGRKGVHAEGHNVPDSLAPLTPLTAASLASLRQPASKGSAGMHHFEHMYYNPLHEHPCKDAVDGGGRMEVGSSRPHSPVASPKGHWPGTSADVYTGGGSDSGVHGQHLPLQLQCTSDAPTLSSTQLSGSLAASTYARSDVGSQRSGVSAARTAFTAITMATTAAFSEISPARSETAASAEGHAVNGSQSCPRHNNTGSDPWVSSLPHRRKPGDGGFNYSTPYQQSLADGNWSRHSSEMHAAGAGARDSGTAARNIGGEGEAGMALVATDGKCRGAEGNGLMKSVVPSERDAVALALPQAAWADEHHAVQRLAHAASAWRGLLLQLVLLGLLGKMRMAVLWPAPLVRLMAVYGLLGGVDLQGGGFTSVGCSVLGRTAGALLGQEGGGGIAGRSLLLYVWGWAMPGETGWVLCLCNIRGASPQREPRLGRLMGACRKAIDRPALEQAAGLQWLSSHLCATAMCG